MSPPESPSEFFLGVSRAGHVGGDHELLEVDAPVPVLVENPEELLQELVPSLSLSKPLSSRESA